MNPNNSNQVNGGVLAAFVGAYLIFWIAIAAFVVFLYWKIISKAGFNGALSLLMLVPCANFVMLIWFAFAEWPIEQRLKMMAGGGASGPSPYFRGPQEGPPPQA